MRDDFCAFILTHGRPNQVITYKTLRGAGYTGRIYLVVDDEDETADQYIEKYGAEVLRFSKAEVQKTFDDADNFPHRKTIVYARNACWDLAEQVGCRYFVQLDDDYSEFSYRHCPAMRFTWIPVRRSLGELFESVLAFFVTTPALTVALSQGGDHIGGVTPNSLRRKAMNSFFCSTDRRFTFVGKVNEDVNTYTSGSRRGALFLTVMTTHLKQAQTQAQSGGMTGTYLSHGTYVKSFYSVLYAPSCVKVGELVDNRSPHPRVHHMINWHRTAPLIVREDQRKARGD